MLVLTAGWAMARGEQEQDSMKSDSMESESMESESMMMATSFTVTIEVRAGAPTPLAPVAWAVYSGANAALADVESVKSHGVANTPSGSSGPGPATPGTSYSFEVEIGEGDHLSFATMYVQSNDLFYSPGEQGLGVVMDSGMMTGNVTEEITLYDDGTEVNEQPGSGPNQPPRQSGPDTGQDEMGAVVAISEVDDGFTYPNVSEVIHVTVQEN